MGKASTAKKTAIPAVLALAAAGVAALSYYGVIDIPVLNNFSRTETTVESTSDNVTEQTTLTTKQNTTEEEKTTETTVASTEEVKPKPLKEDKALKKLFSSVGGMYNFVGYSSTNKSAYKKALGAILSPFGADPLYSSYFKSGIEYFETDEENFGAEAKEKRDPLEKFNDAYRYGKASADNVDYIIKNVFGAEADRSSADVTENGKCRVYYSDGYYYFSCEEGANMSVCADIKISEENSDGTYTFIYDLTYDDELNTFFGTFRSVCKKNESDKKTVWTVLNFIEV